LLETVGATTQRFAAIFYLRVPHSLLKQNIVLKMIVSHHSAPKKTNDFVQVLLLHIPRNYHVVQYTEFKSAGLVLCCWSAGYRNLQT